MTAVPDAAVKFNVDQQFTPSKTAQIDPQLANLQNATLATIRLDNVTIKDWPTHFNLPKQSDIYVITTVADDDSKDPFMVKLETFPHVQKGQQLTLGSTGVMMYSRIGSVPDYFDIRVLIARSRQGLRDTGQAMQDINNNDNFKKAVSALSALVTGPAEIIAGQVDNIIGVIGSILRLEKDDQLIYYAATIFKLLDYQQIGQPLVGQNNYVNFTYKLEVA